MNVHTRLFVLDKPFQPNLMFLSKVEPTGVKHPSGVPLWSMLPALQSKH